jgi:hypothetical protein
MRIQFAFIPVLLTLSAIQLATAQSTPQLDTTAFVLMGEGLGAGMANYGLSSIVQSKDFGALIAAQIPTAFEQPLIQPPGIGDVIGLPGQEVRMQIYPQGSVRQFYLPTDLTKAPVSGPPLFLQNLSVPGQTLNDAVTLRPVAPVVQRNMKQTVFNMILGFPQLIFDHVPLWTQFEYAKAMFPTMAMIELGYYESLNAAVNGNPALMPDPVAFGSTYSSVIAGLRALQAQVIVTTIPNPIDSAYFNSLTAASSVNQISVSLITSLFGINAADLVTRNGLQEISNQIQTGFFTPLPADAKMSAAIAAQITAGVNALNAQIVSAAKANGAVVYDLNAFMHNIKVSGAPAGTTTVTGDYFGGFYSLDGVYPGSTGHALIANDMLKFLNTTYHRNFSLVNVAAVAATDPALQLMKPRDGTLDRSGALSYSNISKSRR